MDYKYIEQLLERYWNCETTLEEEKILRTFFAQEDIPESLRKYKELFCFGKAEKESCRLGDDFDERILAMVESPKRVKARKVTLTRKLMPVFKAAAVVAIVLTLGNAAQTAFRADSRQENTAAVAKPHKGASVAMGDSVSTDTLKKAPAAAIITK